MADPLSAVAIATLAFLNHLRQTEAGKQLMEGIFSNLGEKISEAGLEKINALCKAIGARLGGNPKAEEALTASAQGDVKAVETVAAYVQLAMNEDEAFAAELQELAAQIIQIGQMEGQNIQNIYGGQGQQITGEKATVYQVGPHSTIILTHLPIDWSRREGHRQRPAPHIIFPTVALRRLLGVRRICKICMGNCSRRTPS
jgi:ferritin-like metal-binding protein YciE